MLNKNYLFIFVSVILGIIISFYYNKKWDNNFVIYFFIISISSYIIFYLLGNINIYENFDIDCKNHIDRLIDKLIHEENEVILAEEELDEYKYLVDKLSNKINKLENNDINYINTINNQSKIINELEEECLYDNQDEEHINYNNINANANSATNATNNLESEETIYPYPFPGTNLGEFNLSNAFDYLKNNNLPENSFPFSLRNVNFIYNAGNSTNNVNNDNCSNDSLQEKSNSSQNVNEESCNLPNNNQLQNSNNLGPLYSYDNTSRVYNNSDWIYGTNSWSNNPDYYIPNVNNCPTQVVPNIKPPLNETAKSNVNMNDTSDTVCPIEINNPWSSWKSGDSDPEPFNL